MKEITNEVRNVLLSQGGISFWVDEKVYTENKHFKYRDATLELDKTGNPITQIVSTKTEKLYAMTDETGMITAECKADEVSVKLSCGWKLAPGEAKPQNGSNWVSVPKCAFDKDKV
ncbi:MAG: hypothetical protein VB108_05690 [Anaerolineaceae bacterium]|nr:hypothetical protein [Anaerolineaceae bacterium]